MASPGLTSLLGYLAASCTTLSFVPQIIKIRRQGGRDLSYSMLSVYLVGLMFWLAYGLRMHAAAVIAANIASGALVLVAIILKAAQPSREVLRVEVEIEKADPDLRGTLALAPAEKPRA